MERQCVMTLANFRDVATRCSSSSGALACFWVGLDVSSLYTLNDHVVMSL